MDTLSTGFGILRIAGSWYLRMARSGRVRRMLNKRKAAIGYATYLVASRVAKRMVRRKARAMMITAQSPRRRRLIPLVGGAAVAITGAAVLASRRRTTHPE
jgi:hypothetical protein